MRESALNWLRGRQLGGDVKLGHAQAKAGIRPADGYFNSLLITFNELCRRHGFSKGIWCDKFGGSSVSEACCFKAAVHG